MNDNYVIAEPVPPPPPQGTAGPGPHGAPSAPPTQAAPSVSTSTSAASTSPGQKLPTTGPDATGLALIALVVGAVGVGLVAASARWRHGRAARG